MGIASRTTAAIAIAATIATTIIALTPPRLDAADTTIG